MKLTIFNRDLRLNISFVFVYVAQGLKPVPIFTWQPMLKLHRETKAWRINAFDKGLDLVVEVLLPVLDAFHSLSPGQKFDFLLSRMKERNQ